MSELSCNAAKLQVVKTIERWVNKVAHFWVDEQVIEKTVNKVVKLWAAKAMKRQVNKLAKFYFNKAIDRYVNKLVKLWVDKAIETRRESMKLRVDKKPKKNEWISETVNW